MTRVTAAVGVVRGQPVMRDLMRGQFLMRASGGAAARARAIQRDSVGSAGEGEGSDAASGGATRDGVRLRLDAPDGTHHGEGL